jgi:prefoldin subunit 5
MTTIQDLFAQINAIKSQFEETTQLVQAECAALHQTLINLTKCRAHIAQIKQQLLKTQT